MTVKQYFESVRQAERELKLIRRQQEHALELGTRLGGAGGETHIRSPGVRSPVETAGIRLADLDSELQAEAERYLALIAEARSLIAKIPQERFREVLTLRYICGHSWRTVSDEMDYEGEKSVYKVHGWALQAAEKIFSEMIPNDTK
jgi:hypothetical protein